MALDEPKETDAVFDFEDGLKFVMDKQLLTSAAPVKVDLTYTGFVVDSNLPVGGGSCSSGSCSSGGCGSSGSCCGS
ncbi:hypothetical protein GGQ74_000207 [Desulfobaculum xiamenense]|uniref:HesB-like selenoprotein n=1 Tax=Desulfobaculum xiamenense TaxID=995050 RepID=A0A846QHR4_9BACT|nr:hypothetical protein [Desulfobaculum xiamenense]